MSHVNVLVEIHNVYLLAKHSVEIIYFICTSTDFLCIFLSLACCDIFNLLFYPMFVQVKALQGLCCIVCYIRQKIKIVCLGLCGHITFKPLGIF